MAENVVTWSGRPFLLEFSSTLCHMQDEGHYELVSETTAFQLSGSLDIQEKLISAQWL